MSFSTVLELTTLVTKDSLNLQVASKGVRSLKNSSKCEMDNCIYLIVMYQEMEYLCVR